MRSSSPYEYGDFEGIFDSVRDVSTESELESAINAVRASAHSERAKTYAEQRGLSIGGDIKFFIQEQSQSHFCGAMMRHPNNPNLLYINYFSGCEKSMRDHYAFVFDEGVHGEARVSCFVAQRRARDRAQFLAAQYKKIEALSGIGKGYSLFVEFGLDPFAVYQVRPFKRFETADFEVPAVHGAAMRFDFVFGITPPSGIVLPIIRSLGVDEAEAVVINNYDLLTGGSGENNLDVKFGDYERFLEIGLRNIAFSLARGWIQQGKVREQAGKILRDHHYAAEEFNENAPHCFMISSAQRDEYDTDLSVPRMKALILGEVNTFLTHNLMRLIKKADVAMGCNSLLLKDFFKNTCSLEHKVRLISNGKEAVVIREN